MNEMNEEMIGGPRIGGPWIGGPWIGGPWIGGPSIGDPWVGDNWFYMVRATDLGSCHALTGLEN